MASHAAFDQIVLRFFLALLSVRSQAPVPLFSVAIHARHRPFSHLFLRPCGVVTTARRQSTPTVLSAINAWKVVAAKMIDQLVETAVQFPGYVSLDAVATRYGIDPRRHSGEEYLHLVAQVGRERRLEAPCRPLLGIVSAIVCVT